jgi:putative ABC transport system permease protein
MLAHDFRYALRALRKNPAFAAVAVATLALGIGANTAIFSVVNAVLLRPLPYPESERLVFMFGQDARRGVSGFHFLYPDFVEWRKQSRSYEAVSAHTRVPATLAGAGSAPERVDIMQVNASFLRVLKVRPQMGRDFLEEEDRPGAPRVALLSHGLWQRRLGGDAAAVGKPVTLDGVEYTVVGVLPAGFRAINWQPDVYTPLALPPQGMVTVGAIGRLAPGTAVAQAQAETAAIVPRLNPRFFGTSGRSLRVWGAREYMVRDVHRSLLVLMGAVGLVLLIACANVANLLLARAGARQREMAVRAAMGASRWRIVRQLLAESAVLGLAGGAAGLFLAYWGVQALMAAVPTRYPLIEGAQLDWPVLAFTLAAALFTAVLFGLAPALSASRAVLHENLKEGGRGGVESRGRNRVQRALVVVEVALALVLAVGAGLLIKSFGRLLDVSPGFNPRNVLTAGISLPAERYKAPPDRMRFFASFLERLASSPGVEAAGLVSMIPFGGMNTGRTIRVEGRPEVRAEDAITVWFRVATPGYFRAMEIPLRRGRLISAEDTPAAPLAAVINETMARRFFPGEDPLGRRFGWDASAVPQPGQPAPPWITIVGVVGDVRHMSLAQAPEPELFMAYTQQPITGMTAAVRTAMDPERFAPALREAAMAADPEQAVAQVRAMERVMSESLAERRLAVWLLAIFAGLAVALAAVGIYGVISFAVARRTREIGVRLALGAEPADVRRMVFGQAMRLAGFGLAAGLAAALALTGLMRSILYEVTATDPLVFGGMCALLAAVAALASYIPARRATKVEPVAALRYE